MKGRSAGLREGGSVGGSSSSRAAKRIEVRVRSLAALSPYCAGHGGCCSCFRTGAACRTRLHCP